MANIVDASTFNCFPNLPVEVRCIIWEWVARHPQVIILSEQDRKPKSIIAGNPVPALLHTSTEARQIGLGLYTAFGSMPTLTYIDCERDVFYLSGRTVGWAATRNKYLRTGIRKIIISPELSSVQSLQPMLRIFAQATEISVACFESSHWDARKHHVLETMGSRPDLDYELPYDYYNDPMFRQEATRCDGRTPQLEVDKKKIRTEHAKFKRRLDKATDGMDLEKKGLIWLKSNNEPKYLAKPVSERMRGIMDELITSKGFGAIRSFALAFARYVY